MKQVSKGIDPARYVLAPHVRPHSLDLIEHLDGVDWYHAAIPPRRHDCWVQTRGFLGGSYVARCACGAISMDRPSEVRRLGRYWMDRNQRTVPEPSPAEREPRKWWQRG